MEQAASQTKESSGFKKPSGRLSGDLVQPDLASAFRERIREGMTLYEAFPSDVVDQAGERTTNRSRKWVSLQLSPRRDLFAHNARELYQLLIACKKAVAYWEKIGGFVPDQWYESMRAAQYEEFRFLREPLPELPVAIFVSPHEVVRFAEMMADELSSISGLGGRNRSAIKNRIQRWFESKGGESAWCLVADVFRALYRQTPTATGCENATRLRNEMFDVVGLMWQGNEGYEKFRERQHAEHERAHQLHEALERQRADRKVKKTPSGP